MNRHALLTLVGLSSTLSLFTSIVHGEESVVLEEIIVSAEKRATNLQNTPQTINVVSGNDLAEAAVTQVQDLALMVPGVNINNGGGSSGQQITIRGVGSPLSNDGTAAPSVAQMVDDIYSQSSSTGSGALFDLQQVEVMKGPQGTLYGRNATGGVVSYITQKPRFEKEFSANADIGSYSRLNAGGVLNLPLTDTLALRAAAQSSRRDGFSDENTLSGRVKLLYAPSDNVSLLISTDYALQRNKGEGSTTIHVPSGDPVGGDAWAGPTAATQQSTDNLIAYRGLYGMDAGMHNTTWSITPQLEWKFGDMTSTTVASVNQFTKDQVDGSFSGRYSVSKELSFETRLASNDDSARFKWQAGLYYYRQKVTGVSIRVNGLTQDAAGSITRGARIEDYDLGKLAASSTCMAQPGSSCSAYSINYGLNDEEKDYAVFTQETFAITDRIRLTGGARWQREEAFRGQSYTEDWGDNQTFIKHTDGTPALDRSWNAITWKAGVDADLTPASMVYAMVSTGWKAGSPQDYDAPYDEQKPERLKAYTVGSKNRFFNDRLQLNAEAFYWDYRDRQISMLCVAGVSQGGRPVDAAPGFICPGATPGTALFISGNASKSHIQGISGDISVRPFTADLLTLAVEYLDEAIHDDVGPRAENGCARDCEMAFTPKLSATLSWRHTADMGERGRVVFDLRNKSESRQAMSIATTSPASTQGKYTRTDIGLAYHAASDQWSLRGYVNNVADTLVKTFSSAGFSSSGTASVVYQPPRTYGVQLNVRL